MTAIDWSAAASERPTLALMTTSPAIERGFFLEMQ